MIINVYVADCPRCRRGRMRLVDVPSQDYVNNYLVGDKPAVPEDDRWRYTWLDACLWCGLDEEQFELPEGARDLPDGDVREHLAAELGRFLDAGGSNTAVEPLWREALASEYATAGDLALAFDQLSHAADLATDIVTSWRILVTLAGYARTDEHRLATLARFERAVAGSSPGPELASLLIQLAGLHAALRDFHAAWAAAEHALGMYRDAPDFEHRGHGLAGAAYELVAIGVMLGRDTTAYEAVVQEHWGPLYGAVTVDGLITSKRSQYR